MNHTAIESNAMRLSITPKDKAEAARWIRKGIELVVMDHMTDRPIEEKHGRFQILQKGWTATVTVANGVVTFIQ